MKRFILALLFCLSAPLHAEITDAEADSMGATLASFFQHIRDGKHDAAFALQTKETQDYFGTVDAFVTATKDCCSAIYDASDAQAVGGIETKSGVDVYVAIVDKQFLLYQARFSMKKIGDAWLIDECHIKLLEVGTSI